MTPSTMFERSKLNGGFMSGPKHAMQGMSAKGMTMPDETPAAPGYKESDSPDRQCMSCKNLDMDSGQCGKYGFKPKLYFVCDSFQGEGEDSQEAEQPEQPEQPKFPPTPQMT